MNGILSMFCSYLFKFLNNLIKKTEVKCVVLSFVYFTLDDHYRVKRLFIKLVPKNFHVLENYAESLYWFGGWRDIVEWPFFVNEACCDTCI